MLIAAIDQGTTSTRALVAGDDGAHVALALRHAQRYPHPGHVEHDPLEILANVRRCLAACGKVDAIGLANQGESCLAWDARTGAPLTPIIVWQDARTSASVDALRARGADALTRERCGLPLDAYFSASKLGWILRHVGPARAAHAAGRLRLGTTDAWLLQRLTGVCATDAATASRTSLMHLSTQQWDADLCTLFGVPIDALPPIRDCVGAFGDVDGMPLTASIVDQQASLYGHRCRAAGDVKITFGTGAFALAVAGTQRPDARHGVLPTIAWRLDEPVYALEGGVYDAGAAIDWAGRLGLYGDVAELDRFEAPAAIARDLAFVPALSGLACPHWDRDAAALWLGMGAATTKRDLCQALLEGIALRAAEVVGALARQLPLSPRLSIDGGVARNRYFAQFLADVLERDVSVHGDDEITAHGCAALAARGLGAELPPPQGAVREYAPRLDAATAQAWRERFAAAVDRSARWRLPMPAPNR